MNYRAIIRDAWAFTQNHKGLMMWYAFLPALITTIVSIGYVVYNYFAFRKSGLFNTGEESFLTEILGKTLEFLKENPDLIVPLAITAGAAVLIWIFYPTFAKGAMVQIIARKRNGQPVRLIDGVKYGIKSFLPLFEYHIILRGFSLTAAITEVVFVMRNLGSDFLKVLLPIFAIITVVGLILHLIFTYSEMFIVIDKYKVFGSMKRSTSLVVDHWQSTLLVLILLMLIGLRIIFNLILVIVIPMLIIGGTGFFVTLQLHIGGFILAGIVAAIGLFLSGYLGGTLSVFSNAVWTFTFLELTRNPETSAREPVGKSQ